MTPAMHEPRAQVVLMIRAFEELDGEGHVLPWPARAAATRRALMLTGLADWEGKLSDAWTFRNGETVFRRARLLFDGLRRKHPVLAHIFRSARKGSGILPVLLTSSFLLGAAGSLIAPSRPPDRVAWSLLVLGAWSLTVLTWLVLGRFVRPVRRPLASRFTTLFLRITLRRALGRWRQAEGSANPEARITAEALKRFAGMWHRAARPLLDSRARLVLHAGATALGGGAVAGIFLREGAEAGWHAVGAALLAVLVPRVGMGLFEMRRTAKLAGSVPVSLQAPYYRRVFAPGRGARKRVELLPYGYRPPATTMVTLTTLLHDFFGARTVIRVFDPLKVGGQPPTRSAPPPGEDETCRVVLFDLDQTPQPDPHGVFVEAIRSGIAPDRDRALVFLDCSSAGARGLVHERREELVGAWREVVAGAGMSLVELHLDRPAGETGFSDEMIAAVRAGLWPPPETP